LHQAEVQSALVHHSHGAQRWWCRIKRYICSRKLQNTVQRRIHFNYIRYIEL